MNSRNMCHILAATLFAVLATAETNVVAAAAAEQAERFASPEEAVSALLDAARESGNAKVAALFGSRYAQLFSSGDEVEDKNNRTEFLKMAEAKSSIEKEGENKAILHFGADNWAFPVPLVKSGTQWQFDAEQGEKEIRNRRIGANELKTLGVIEGYVEAQAEYANIDRDGDGVAEYATKLRSSPGKYDGLFWEAEPGQSDSPLGPLVAQARAEGYRMKSGKTEATPYHGYFYRILTRQGRHAPGGKYNYIINGNMIAGFALVAFPAIYGNSGVMTFMVNHQGKIYQKNLGPKTVQIADAIKSYDPDSTWEPVDMQSIR
ncbi:MAG: DUF2950 domain-containing protein [Gammaproteobacteria bacterium]